MDKIKIAVEYGVTRIAVKCPVCSKWIDGHEILYRFPKNKHEVEELEDRITKLKDSNLLSCFNNQIGMLICPNCGYDPSSISTLYTGVEIVESEEFPKLASKKFCYK